MGSRKTYDYWTSVHGRNSFDNAGAAIKSYVHYSSNYDNAYWNGSVMTYGDAELILIFLHQLMLPHTK
jgi:Zn-dependent metalloprotease